MTPKNWQNPDSNTTASAGKPRILLTFDVEDWFQVENFKPNIPFSTWTTFPLRVEQNTARVMDLLDLFPGRPKATFFILGWLAEKCPDLVRQIHRRGHEVASHGFGHDLCRNLPPDTLKKDLIASRHLLEDLIGEAVKGYRAPSFSVDERTLELIREAGYGYDSSLNSFSGHGRYGSLDLTGFTKMGAAYGDGKGFFELPVSNLNLGPRVVPLGGGGYFRLLPFYLFGMGIDAVLKQDDAFVFYAHPWEFDPDQPRVHEAPAWFKFRHYINLHRTGKKLSALIRRFNHARFETLGTYVRNLT